MFSTEKDPEISNFLNASLTSIQKLYKYINFTAVLFMDILLGWIIVFTMYQIMETVEDIQEALFTFMNPPWKQRKLQWLGYVNSRAVLNYSFQLQSIITLSYTIIVSNYKLQ